MKEKKEKYVKLKNVPNISRPTKKPKKRRQRIDCSIGNFDPALRCLRYPALPAAVRLNRLRHHCPLTTATTPPKRVATTTTTIAQHPRRAIRFVRVVSVGMNFEIRTLASAFYPIRPHSPPAVSSMLLHLSSLSG